MTISVTKPSVNLREKLNELDQPQGIKGTELMRADTVAEARNLIGAGRKNLIINGGFDVWQRGTTFTNVSNDTYASDRWVCLDGIGDVTTTWTKKTPSDPYTYVERTSGSATAWGLHQFIEMTEAYYPSGTKFTISADVKHVSGTDDYYFWFHYRPDSTWGNSTWNLSSTAESVGTSGTRITATFTTTSDVTAGDICLKILPSSTSNGQKYGVKNIQVELGSVATDFEHRSYGEELALCQRYYQQHFIGIRGAKGNGSNMVGITIDGTVNLRVAPTAVAIGSQTLSVYSNSAIITSNTSISSVNTSDYEGSSGYYNFTVSSSSITDNRGYTVQSTSRLALDAEL